ncbi:MAG TPA: DUF6569 family protein [Egibacteraceae bacterium]|nr:DUF6569 family protein [Egibacteraceae bacterium]
MPLARLHVGAPMHRGALTLFPVWTEHPEPANGYITGRAAEAAQALVVDELETAVVPELLAVNHGPAPVLLLEGEVLAGGLQTRVLNVSVLLPPQRPIPVPVGVCRGGALG